MAQISFTIPDDKYTLVIDTLAAYFSYNPDTDGPKAPFVKFRIIEWLKARVREGNVAKTQADTLASYVDPDIT